MYIRLVNFRIDKAHSSLESLHTYVSTAHTNIDCTSKYLWFDRNANGRLILVVRYNTVQYVRYGTNTVQYIRTFLPTYIGDDGFLDRISNLFQCHF